MPSAEEATEDQLLLGAVVGAQVAPESPDVYIKGGAAATSLAPSAEEATEVQPLAGALANLHGPE
jgi:hypothetical protein